MTERVRFFGPFRGFGQRTLTGSPYWHPQRRQAEGKSDREIKRCLKRYVARELFRLLEDPQNWT
jgi:hypothetical protein